MTNGRLLTECAMNVPPEAWGVNSIINFVGAWVNKADYNQRRDELINEPDDADAPEWPKVWKAQDSTGEWFWYKSQPATNKNAWIAVCQQSKASVGKIPAGHDWRKTLKEIKHVKRELNPTSSSLTDIQAREFSDESGTCSDGAPCRPNYCDGCPNAPEDESEWVLLDRRLNGRDAINPNHYRAGKVECIDALESATINKRGIEAVCTANVIKYLWRYESKNGLEDVHKARWYLDRLAQRLGE